VIRPLFRRRFTPLLAGARWSDRSVACLGTAAGIGTTAILSSLAPHAGATSYLVAPMGASAVLLFAVPSSPMSQPWPIIGGSFVSAAVGIAVALFVPAPHLAVAIAVACALFAMSALRCLHPPGGACAILPILSGAVPLGDYGYALLPVGLNAVLLVATGAIFHRFSGHSYPHRPVPVAGHTIVAPAAAGVLSEDLDAALDDLGETFDVSREDLELLFRIAEQKARTRAASPMMAPSDQSG
jgi:CBS domain-containing membrane protein